MPRPAAAALALFALNALLIQGWFGIEYLDERGSIEPAFLGIARYIRDHPWDTNWFPFWYNGVPFENVYPPLLHYCVAFAAWLGGISTARAYHVITGLFYCLGPVTLFALAWRFSRRLWESFAAGLVFSLLSPCLVLLPTLLVDIESVFSPKRLQNLTHYGEGPHIAALTLLPLAILALDWALERPQLWRCFLAAIALASVPLTNWIGAFALAWAVISYLSTQDRMPWKRAWPLAVALGLWAWLLASQWLTPSTIADVNRNAQISGGQFPMDALRYSLLAALAAAALLTGAMLRRRGVNLAIRFAAVFGTAMIGIPVLDDWAGFYLVPQPIRYQLELEMAVALLIAFAFAWAPRAPRAPRALLAGVALAAVIAQSYVVHDYADRVIRPLEIEKTLEWKVAQQLVERFPGERIYSLGSVRYAQTAFGDIPQFGGGFGQGVHFPQWWAADYGLLWLKNHAGVLTWWLEAYGIDLVVAGAEPTDEFFKVWVDGGKFEGHLQALWRDQGDAIYRVPRRSRSLAHIVPEAVIVKRTPMNVLDYVETQPYVAALENARFPIAKFRWRTTSAATIDAAPRAGEVISVQVAYDRRWKASCDGVEWPVEVDGLGQTVIHPAGTGACRVDFRFERGWAYPALGWMSWIFGVFALVLAGRSRGWGKN